MTKFALHLLAIPQDVQGRISNSVRRNVAGQGVLEGEAAAVESVSLQPGERALLGKFRGERARMLAQRFEELFDAGDIETVAYFGLDETTQQDGYYTLRNIDVRPTDPRIDPHQLFSGALTRVGTRQSHFRAVDTTPVQPTNGNDFGSDTTGYVGIDANASRIRWVDPEDKDTEVPTLVATRNAEHGDVEMYDTQASSYSNPILIYDLDYSEEGKVDCRVYDDRGNASKTDGNGNIQWASTYRSTHDFDGAAIVDNGIVRYNFDLTNGLSVTEWNDGTSSWDSVSLGTSDWALYDIDITGIGLARVAAQVEFRDTTTSPDSFYRLDFVLHRGYEWAQWFNPDGASPPTPSGLQTLLDPVANDDVVDPQDVATVLPRKEVRL